MQNQLTNLTELITKFVNSNSASTLSSGTLPSKTIANLRSDLKAITTRSEATKDTLNPTNNGRTEDVQPQDVQSESSILNPKPVTSLISEPVIALIFKDMSFEISFTDALIPMPKFASTLKALIGNKEKLSEMARTPLNEHYSAVLLKKLPKKLGDPGKFLIPRDFPGMTERLALADLGASINLMPWSVWKRLSLPDLTLTCMTLELADRSISHPVRVAEDVYVKVGSFHFSADFVVVDFDADPRVPLILGRSFLKTGRALIDVFEGELTLRVGKKAITFNLDQTSRYSANYTNMTAKRIDVIDMACEEYSQEVLEVDAFLAIEDDPTSSEVDQSYLDPEGDILLLQAFLNAKSDKSSIDEPPEVELKDLPPHLKYAFLEGDDKLPVIIAKDLSVEEKTVLITILKSHKRAIAWKLSVIKGIDPEFCTHKILMEEDFEPAVQHQRRVNPKIHDVIKQEVIKLLNAGLIYPIFDGPWVSPVHCVPKKGGFTVVENEDNELILTRLVTGWRVCIDYLKLNEATSKDHFSLPYQEKTTFTCPYETFAYRRMPFGLCNAPGTFRRCMMAISYDMIEKTMEVFMDDFSVFGNSFQSCLSHLERMLKRCEDTNLCLNWEKSYFMVKEAYKTPNGCTPYKLVYEKACHLPIELEHKAYWALKHANFDLKTAGDHKKVQLNKLNELHDQAYGNSLIYKEKTKRLHDSKIKNRVFNIGDRVLLFNSRLNIFSGKLKSRWCGSFTISHVYPYGTIELSQPDGPNFKVNGHRLKHYFEEDIPKVAVPDLQTFPRDH
nr:reverse transcriptase domain-containing protein [Tanacetum cinerariifolium]